jgi:hypothetical protein
MDASLRLPQPVNPVNHNSIYGFTHSQRIFVLAAAVAVVAATVFALQSLGIPQAIAVGGFLGFTTLISLSEFIRVRMVNLSRTKSYHHSQWALFPKGFFSHANDVIRLRKVKRQHHSAPDTPRLPVNSTPLKPETLVPRSLVTTNRPKVTNRSTRSSSVGN